MTHQINGFNLHLYYILGFPCGSAGKESTCNVRDLGSVPGLGRSPGERKGNPLQYSGLENSMNCVVYGVTKSRTRLSDFHFTSLYRIYHPKTTENTFPHMHMDFL